MSILRYPGGKSRAIKVLEEHLPDINSYDLVISPFFGGGSFELYVKEKYNKLIIGNDKFKPLCNFWKHAQQANSQLVEKIQSLLPMTKENFYKYRKDLFEIDDELLKASYYYIINRCSFSGTTCSGGYSEQAATKRLTTSALNRLKEFDGRNIVFHDMDFNDLIDYYATQEDCSYLVYADPPYYLEENSKLYGQRGDLHENFNHQRLFEQLSKCQQFLLCYNDCEHIRNLYQNYNIKKVNWTYGMNKSKKSSEIIITSYPVT